jgi:cysteine-S-conjugate beta-lyase
MSHFDTPHNRYHTNSVKYDLIHLDESIQNDLRYLPLWVADMDFATPPAVANAMARVALTGIYGYSNRPKSYLDAIAAWMLHQHHFAIDTSLLAHSPCVMTSIAYLIQSLCHKGDAILINTPVYPEFASAIRQAHCTVLENVLLKQPDLSYQIDWLDLEEKLQIAKLYIFCSPHNPVGKVWSKDDLTRLADLILKYQVPIIADEIHSDLCLFDHTHIPFATIHPEAASLTYTLFSASKTFNMASVHASSLLFPNQAAYQAFDSWLHHWHIDRNNIFSLAGVEAAYTHGRPWLSDLRHYLEANYHYLQTTLATHMPKLRPSPLEATYLLWLDCSALNLNDADLQEFFYHHAKLILTMGHAFGSGGSQHVRINIATQRATLEQAIQQLQSAYQQRHF